MKCVIRFNVGGVTQWLGCRSLDGGLSLTRCRSMVTGDHFMDSLNCPLWASQLYQHSLPSLGVGK